MVYLILLTDQKQYYKIDPSVKLITPSRQYKKNLISKFFYFIWSLFYIRNTCKKIKPTSILSFNERYNNLVLLSLFSTSFNLYASDRNNPYMDIGRLHSFLRNLLYKYATGIIAQTEIAKEILSKKTKNKNIKVIPNPIRKISKTKTDQKNLEKKIILNVGRNVAQKNQLELIEVFSSCNYSNWVLRIIGNGHLKNKLLNKVRKLNI